jgi:hypothetical protein
MLQAEQGHGRQDTPIVHIKTAFLALAAATAFLGAAIIGVPSTSDRKPGSLIQLRTAH